METLTYQPPLRGAVLFAVGLNRGAVSAETLAEIAGDDVKTHRARAFASILIAIGALKETPRGYVAGPKWETWSGRPSRARPRQTSDRLTIATMDIMRRNIALRVRHELKERNWSIRELARRSGVQHQYIVQLTKYCDTPPACCLIVLAKALDLSVEELARPMTA